MLSGSPLANVAIVLLVEFHTQAPARRAAEDDCVLVTIDAGRQACQCLQKYEFASDFASDSASLGVRRDTS